MNGSRSRPTVGFMPTGTGVGWLADHVVAGMFIGPGLGMIASEILARRSEW